MTSESGHSKLLLVHKSNNVIRDVCHVEALVMIRVAHISVVEEPDISHVKDFIALHGEELLKVFNWLDQVREPNQSWKILSFALKQGTSELNGLSALLLLSL